MVGLEKVERRAIMSKNGLAPPQGLNTPELFNLEKRNKRRVGMHKDV